MYEPDFSQTPWYNRCNFIFMIFITLIFHSLNTLVYCLGKYTVTDVFEVFLMQQYGYTLLSMHPPSFHYNGILYYTVGLRF
jgi:hypothetical protein